MRFASLAVLLLLNVPIASAEDSPAFPFWVKATQGFKYSDSDREVSPGTPEQVIGEEGVNYVVVAPDGQQLRMPKAYSQKITGDEAALLFLTERTMLRNSCKKLEEDAKKRLAECDSALKASQAKVAGYEKTFAQQSHGNTPPDTQQVQETSGGGGGVIISKSDRARMERDVWTAGLARSLHVARQMTDAELGSLWVQARQILEIRAAGNR